MLNSSTQRILNKFSQPLELILFLALTISAQNFFSISDSKSLSSESSQPYDSSKISEYEKQARMQGYSDEQIDLIKSRYGNTSKTTNKSVIETTAPDYSFRLRSEERRVGKECRSRWRPRNYKKINSLKTKWTYGYSKHI